MNLQTIQEKLNTMFAGIERKLVFWYDDNAEFAEEIESIELDNAKLHHLKKDNWFYTKYFLEVEDKVNNYLIYAPFPKPADKDNHLADTVYYSKLFHADKISLVCVDLHIPDKFKEQLKQYPKFFSSSERERTEKKANERIDRFAALDIESWNSEVIDIGLMAVLSGVKTSNFDEVLKKLIIESDYKDNAYISTFDKMGLLRVFWQLCGKYYGYTEDKPTLDKLVITLLITYTAHNFKESFPKAWEPFVSSKKNDAYVFVRNLMNDRLCCKAFDEIAQRVAIQIKAEQLIKSIPVENYLDCDTFDLFDKNVIAYLADALCEGRKLSTNSFSLANDRKKLHYASRYLDSYFALDYANKMITSIHDFSQSCSGKTLGGIIRAYTVDGWAAIDQYYRLFYYAYDRIAPTDHIRRLRDVVENTYTNGYLSKLSIQWADKLESLHSLTDLPGAKQYEFYNNYVAPTKKECTVVIISDAFRYECALQLHKEYEHKVNFTSELTSMVATLPAYTKLGMAVLMPHREVSFTDDFEVLVDGQLCVSTEQREAILQKYNPASVAGTYARIMAMSRDDVRKLMTEKDLIYIYHDQIDARGDHPSTENEVFVACHEAMEEITKLIQKLTVDKSITNYIITADHGFLYKRDSLDESDKAALPKFQNAFQNKRFILSKEKAVINGTLQYSLDYLGGNNADVFVTVPRGADVFKMKGGGQNYVHGGASLQELILPVLKVKTGRYKKETENVEVSLVAQSRKITNLITYLDFMQTENVSETVIPVELKLFFEDETGEKISNENMIVANLKDTPPERRKFREKFTFRNRKYLKSENYYLVMQVNAEQSYSAAIRHEFIIDIALADDLGFNV